jgi:hypothetical protein
MGILYDDWIVIGCACVISLSDLVLVFFFSVGRSILCSMSYGLSLSLRLRRVLLAICQTDLSAWRSASRHYLQLAAMNKQFCLQL